MVKRFPCTVCGKEFARLFSLQRHLRNTSTTHFRCTQCAHSQVFSSKSALSAHAKKSHERKLVNRDESVLNSLPAEDSAKPSDDVLDQYPDEYRDIVEQAWSWVKTRHVKRNVSSSFNLRFPAGRLSVRMVTDFIRKIDFVSMSEYKLQIQFGHIYRTIRTLEEDEGEEGEQSSDAKFFLPQRPTGTNRGFLPEPWLVSKREHVSDLITRLEESDIMEHISLNRPSTKG